MLKLGGYINIVIAIGHIVGLFWANKMFEVTGIGKEMTELAQTHSSLPYLLTILVAIAFFIFGETPEEVLFVQSHKSFATIL